jgi:uncharacterized protein with PIN domain
MVLLTGDNVHERASEFLTMVRTRFFRAVRCDRCDEQIWFFPSTDNETMAVTLAQEGWVPGYDVSDGHLILCPKCRNVS